MAKILVVEDETAVREMIVFHLKRAGFYCQEAADAEAAQVLLGREYPALIILDWMLPGLSGIDFARRLREDESTRSIPVIMLSARSEERDKVDGLTLGADDYVTKPFSARELIARIKALLRRAGGGNGEAAIETGGIVLDPASHRVLVSDQDVALGPKEFRLLHIFMSHPNRVYSRGQLLDLAWEGNIHVGERTVDVHISNLRKALEPFGLGRIITTVRGAGYRFLDGT